ncbi:MAG: DUF1538 family protein [Spirochaetia bacterium]
MIPYDQQMALWASYGSSKIYEQLKPVLCVVLYLLFSQVFIFNESLESISSLVLGTLSILLGLSLFLESVRLCVMPLAEMAGFYLRTLFPVFVIVFVAIILGSIATIAEPAVAIFQQTESSFMPDSPSLAARIIQSHRSILAYAIAIGLGTAAGLGILTTSLQWPLKYVLCVLIVIALGLSVFAFLNKETQDLVALAWDAGGVATGPITVSFIISFGMGVNRGAPKQGSGLGIIALASLLPVIFMLVFGLLFYYFHTSIPASISSLFTTILPKDIPIIPSEDSTKLTFFIALKNALQSTLPIILSLATLIFLILRKKLPFPDEKILGLLFLIFGSMTFTLGIEKGLLPLGEKIGHSASLIIMPSEKNLSNAVLMTNFQLENLQNGYDTQARPIQFFHMIDKSNPRKSKMIEFLPQYYDAQENTYLFIPSSSKNHVSKAYNRLQGYLIILIFSLILGIAVTALEPTLITFAKTIEEATVGTMPSSFLIKMTATGAGLGLTMGILRLLMKIPFTPVICLTYCLLLVLTLISKNEAVEIAWDAAGATTGPITIPLVIALQMGLGKATMATDIFGTIALTCAFPAILMLIHGQYVQAKERKRLLESLPL